MEIVVDEAMPPGGKDEVSEHSVDEQPTNTQNVNTLSVPGSGSPFGDDVKRNSFLKDPMAEHKPLKIAKWTVEKTGVVCLAIMVVVILLTMLTSFFFTFSDWSPRAFLVESNKWVKLYDALELAKADIAVSDSSTAVKPQTQQQQYWTYMGMFEMLSYNGDLDEDNPSATDYWILTPEYIETMIKYEDMIYENEMWRKYFCLVNDTSDDYDCDYAVMSPSREIAMSYDYNYSAMTTSAIKSYILSQSADPVMQSYFNPEFITTNQTYLYRAFYFCGLPTPYNITNTSNGVVIKHSQYVSEDDEFTDQYNNWIDNFASDIFEAIVVEHNGELKDNGLKIILNNWEVLDTYFSVILAESTVYLLGAICMVYLYMAFHLKSPILSLMALFQIMMSFPIAFVFYRILFQVDYFDFLNTLIIFVLLGVGADDVFVFTDAWHQSVFFVDKPSDMVQRMTYTYRRAAKAMLVTQTTTFFAFLATASSPLTPVAAFGIWASCVIACNYFLVITLYPTCLVLYEKYIKGCERCQICTCEFCDRCPGRGDSTSLETHVSSTQKAVEMVKNTDQYETADETPVALKRQLSSLEIADEYRWLERFLGITWSNIILKFRWYILGFYLVVFCLAAWSASLIEEQTEDETWFDSDHFMAKVISMAEQYTSGEQDDLTAIHMAWGIEGVHRGGSSRWDLESYGSTVFDNSFDMSSPEAQLYIWDICEFLNSDHEYSYDSDDTVTCPLDYLPQYLENVYGASFPYVYLSSDEYAYVFDDNETEYSAAIELNDGVTYDATTQKRKFGEMMWNYSQSDYGLGYFQNGYFWPYYSDSDEMYIVRFLSIEVLSPLSWESDKQTALDHKALWVAYVNGVNDADVCPTGVCNLYQTSERWCWLVTQAAFVVSAMQGIGIAMPLAFVILILSTHNWVMAIFATLDIVGVMLCELGVMAAQGWKFGISESTSVVIIIGFSVDYVVHLAHAYLESPEKTRADRLGYSLLTMGISVVSGAMTTFLAGIFLIFPAMIFFQKMGILIMTTISLSIVWALTFFAALLAAFGPEGDRGNIPFGEWWQKLKDKIADMRSK